MLCTLPQAVHLGHVGVLATISTCFIVPRFCLLAENRLRLRTKFYVNRATREQTEAAILSSMSARDYGLNAHDVANVRLELSTGDFRRHDDDATSVQMLVRIQRCALQTDCNADLVVRAFQYIM